MSAQMQTFAKESPLAVAPAPSDAMTEHACEVCGGSLRGIRGPARWCKKPSCQEVARATRKEQKRALAATRRGRSTLPKPHCEGCGAQLAHPRAKWCYEPACDALRKAAAAASSEGWRESNRIKDRRCKGCGEALEDRGKRGHYCERSACREARVEERRKRNREAKRKKNPPKPQRGIYGLELDEVRVRAMAVEDPGRKRIARAAYRTARAEGREPTREALLDLAAECMAWAERLRPVPGGPWEPGG